MFEEIYTLLQEENEVGGKTYLLTYVMEIAKKMGKQLSEEDIQQIFTIVQEQAAYLVTALNEATSYRQKEELFACEDALLGLLTEAVGSPENLPENILETVRTLVNAVQEGRRMATAVEAIFDENAIQEAPIAELIELATATPDEFEKTMLWQGLLDNEERYPLLSEEAKGQFTAYMNAEWERYLAMESLDEDCLDCLELMADAVRLCGDAASVALLYRMMERGHANVNCYAVGSLLKMGFDVPQQVVEALAHDLTYAELSYGFLREYDKTALFPPACATPEYLAMSNMVHWLTFPTELNKAPDEIVYIGKATFLFKKEVFYIFKFRSDSDTLSEELKNQWLIGWSATEGSTFSNFDLLSAYEKDTPEATVKNIKKHLLK